jgi:hypothetical protein
VIRARHNVEFSRDSYGDQTPSVLDVFVNKQVDRTHDDKGWREARQVFDTRWNSASGNLG